MATSLVLDSGVLGLLCHARKEVSGPPTEWLADYELRRKLLHLIATGRASTRTIERLDQLRAVLIYLPLTTETMRHAAELWAGARTRGVPTASDASLDGDVILAAQAIAVGGTVVTNNVRHLDRFVAAVTWEDVT
jgi:predicted nucleic acid-binding protein